MYCRLFHCSGFLYSANRDYLPISTNVILTQNRTSLGISVNIVDDEIFEEQESFLLMADPLSNITFGIEGTLFTNVIVNDNDSEST